MVALRSSAWAGRQIARPIAVPNAGSPSSVAGCSGNCVGSSDRYTDPLTPSRTRCGSATTSAAITVRRSDRLQDQQLASPGGAAHGAVAKAARSSESAIFPQNSARDFDQSSLGWRRPNHADFSANGQYFVVTCEFSGSVLRLSAESHRNFAADQATGFSTVRPTYSPGPRGPPCSSPAAARPPPGRPPRPPPTPKDVLIYGPFRARWARGWFSMGSQECLTRVLRPWFGACGPVRAG